MTKKSSAAQYNLMEKIITRIMEERIDLSMNVLTKGERSKLTLIKHVNMKT